MRHSRIGQLIKQFEEGKITRRELGARAAVMGMTAGALSLGISLGSDELLARRVAAQESADAGLLTGQNDFQATWIRNFNPLGPAGGSVRWVFGMGMYESLAIWNVQQAKLIPWLGESYAWSDDNLELTWTLRKGITWCDGEDFTADDVVFTWQLFFDFEGLGGNGARTVINETEPIVTAVEKVDDYTVKWVFERPYTVGLADLSQQYIVPEHIWKDIEDPVTFTNENPVGTGPFTEVSRFEAQIYEVRKNPNYWQPGKPYIEGYRCPAFPANDQINLATMNGEVDWTANFLPDIEATFVAKDPEHNHYWFSPTGGDIMLYLNQTVAPFDQVDVRKALSMAIDREQIVMIAMYDYTIPADPTGLSYAFENEKTDEAKSATWCTLNVDEANKLLDAAGCTRDGDWRKTPDGKPMEYELLVVSGWTDWVQSCDIMATNFKEIGVKVTVKPYDYTTWLDKVQKGDFTMSIGWTTQGSTIYNFYRAAMSDLTYQPIGEVSGENWHRSQNADATALLAKYAGTSDPTEQADLSAQLQQMFAETAPCLPLFPGPMWYEYTTFRFEGFPNADDPYCTGSTWAQDAALLTRYVHPVGGTGDYVKDVIPPAGSAEATPAR